MTRYAYRKGSLTELCRPHLEELSRLQSEAELASERRATFLRAISFFGAAIGIGALFVYC